MVGFLNQSFTPVNVSFSVRLVLLGIGLAVLIHYLYINTLFMYRKGQKTARYSEIELVGISDFIVHNHIDNYHLDI